MFSTFFSIVFLNKIVKMYGCNLSFQLMRRVKNQKIELKILRCFERREKQGKKEPSYWNDRVVRSKSAIFAYVIRLDNQ